MTHAYDSLPTATCIRLLRYGGRRDGLPRLSLETYELDQAPPYYALSYTWGNPYIEERSEYEGTRKLYCNDALIDVGLNLWKALDQLPELFLSRPTRLDCTYGFYKKTRLIIAAEEGLLAEVEALLRAGADTSIQDKHGETALHYAAENANFDVVKALTRPEYLWSDAWVPAIRDFSNRTALDCARQKKWGIMKGYRETISYLESLVPRKPVPCEDSRQHWWVDALCVDQSNQKERSAQVRMMSSIFSTAKHVPVWLGEADSDSKATFRSIRDMVNWYSSSQSYGSNRDLVSDAVSASTSFFGRRWFARTWVFQEALLGKEVTFHCGPEVLEQSQFLTLWNNQSLLSDLPRETVHAIRQGLQLAQLKSKPPNVIDPSRLGLRLPMRDLLFYTSRTQCTDPRDCILSLLGLLEPTDVSNLSRLQVDYTMPTSHIYIQATRYLLSTMRNLSVLSCVAMWFSLNARHDADENDRLPSWVPDYHAFSSIRGPRDTIERYTDYVVYNLHPSKSIRNSVPRTIYGWSGDTFSFNIWCPLNPELNAPAYTVDFGLSNPAYRELPVSGLCIDRIRRVAQPCQHWKIRFQADWLSLTAELPATTPKGLSLATALACTVFGGLIRREALRVATNISDAKVLTMWRDLICQSVVSSRTASKAAGREQLDDDELKELKRLKEGDEGDGFMVDIADIDVTEVDPDEAEEQFRGRLRHKDNFWFREALEKALSHRTIYTTEAGYLGLGPAGMRAGDEVWLLPGSSVPFLLRPSKDEGRYRHVGETYIHEIMRGEAIPENFMNHMRNIVLI